jgi:hypothetical protein
MESKNQVSQAAAIFLQKYAPLPVASQASKYKGNQLPVVA